MSKTIDTLVRMLDEERALRIDAQTLGTVLREQFRETTENLEFQFSRNDSLVTQNDGLREQIYELNRTGSEYWQREFENLKAKVWPKLTEWMIEPIFKRDPEYYRVNKIPFIKAVREESGLGLKEAKDLVDAFLVIDSVAPEPRFDLDA